MRNMTMEKLHVVAASRAMHAKKLGRMGISHNRQLISLLRDGRHMTYADSKSELEQIRKCAKESFEVLQRFRSDGRGEMKNQMQNLNIYHKVDVLLNIKNTIQNQDHFGPHLPQLSKKTLENISELDKTSRDYRTWDMRGEEVVRRGIDTNYIDFICTEREIDEKMIEDMILECSDILAAYHLPEQALQQSGTEKECIIPSEKCDGIEKIRECEINAAILWNLRQRGQFPKEYMYADIETVCYMACSSTELGYVYDDLVKGSISPETFSEIMENVIYATIVGFICYVCIHIVCVPLAIIFAAFDIILIAQAITQVYHALFPAGFWESEPGYCLKEYAYKVRVKLLGDDCDQPDDDNPSDDKSGGGRPDDEKNRLRNRRRVMQYSC